MRVCRADEGNAAAFTCTYHGWTFGNDGKLVGVPGYREYYYEELDMEHWGLVPVAQLETYHGFIFATFDPQAPPLREYLGDMAWYLDFVFDRTEGGIEVIGGVNKWVMQANWKLGADNFIGDGYHVQVSHISAVRTGFAGSLDRFRANQRRTSRGYQVQTGQGHAFVMQQQSIAEAEALPEFQEYAGSRTQEAEARLGSKVYEWAPGISTMFPNLSFLPVRHNFRVWHPRGPDKMEVWSFCYADKGTPPDVKERIRTYYLRAFGQAGAFEMDDGENWDECTNASKGVMGRRDVMNYQMGLGHQQTHEELPGLVSPGAMAEHNQRGFYKRWAEMIGAETWADVPMTGEDANGHKS
jgi:3-phenylpropionate/trans-cinnamate dioxygenase alpha subunit